MIRLYMDVHIPKAIVDGLRQRGVDVMAAQEDGTTTLPDPELLGRATVLGRVLFTHDKGFKNEASERQRTDIPFAGIVYAHPLKVSVGQSFHDLELIATAAEPEEYMNMLEYLPL
jgi:hypothetical protein